MNTLTKIVIAGACLSLCRCSFVPESSFELAPESRLPKWFTPPGGLSRSDVTVKMDYYIDSAGRTAKFILLDRKKKPLAKVSGKLRGLEPLTVKDKSGSRSSIGYPSYEVITVAGVTEVIEHRRMEPIFYISDDPAVLSELGMSSAP